MFKRVISTIVVLVMVINFLPIQNMGLIVMAENSAAFWDEDALEYVRQQVVDYANRDNYSGEIICFEDECVDRGDYIWLTLRYSRSEEEVEEYVELMGFPPSANTWWADVTVDKSTGEVSGFGEVWYVDFYPTNTDNYEKIKYNNNYYAVLNGVADTWEEAKIYCESLGGHLAVINDDAENNAVYDIMKQFNYDSAYFGYSDADDEGSWKWIDGYYSDYSNWNSGEPNSENPNEDYGMFYVKYKYTWNDGDFGGRTANGGIAFICEWEGKKETNTNSSDIKNDVETYLNILQDYLSIAVRYDMNYKSLDDDTKWLLLSHKANHENLNQVQESTIKKWSKIFFNESKIPKLNDSEHNFTIEKNGDVYNFLHGDPQCMDVVVSDYILNSDSSCTLKCDVYSYFQNTIDKATEYGLTKKCEVTLIKNDEKNVTGNDIEWVIDDICRVNSYKFAGKCGDDFMYAIDEDNIAYIYGNGKMYDYIFTTASGIRSSSPFSEGALPVVNFSKIYIEEGVTYIGTCTFPADCSATEIYFPKSVVEIGDEVTRTFQGSTSVWDAGLSIGDYTIFCYENSYVHQYAIKHDLKYKLIDTADEISTTTNQYTATYIGEGGEVICTNTLNVGETAKYDMNTYGIPKSSDEYSNFIGWGINRSDYIPQSETYKGEYGDITYYALFQTETCNIKWYNGETLLKEENIPKGTIPQYKGEIPKSCDYEIGIIREFLGWTESDNSNYEITIPSVIKNVYTDMVYYTVFSENTSPTIDDELTYQEIKDIDYINQHILSARQKYWTKFNYTSQAKKKMQEDKSLEVANGVWSGVELTVDVINFEIGDIADKITANDYNVIMLEMFNAVENSGMSNDIWNDAVMESLDEYLKGVKATIDTQKITNNMVGSEELEKISIEFDEIYRKYDKMQYINPETAILRLYEDMADFEIKHNKAMEDIEIDLKGLTIYNDVVSVADDGMKFVSTMADWLGKMENVVAAKAYINMDETYQQILWDMYAVASKYEGNAWEIADLKNAIVYALQYYENYEGKAVEQLLNITITSITDLSSSMLINDILEDRTINFIAQAFGVDSAVAGPILVGLQAGSQLGMLLSDAIFDTSKQQDMYVKIKEYGVLQEVMRTVVDDRANKLLSEDDIPSQYNAALAYDKAYKMYMYIEASGCTAIAQYEKSFELPKGIKRYMQKWIGADTAYWIADKIWNYSEDSLEEAALRHVQNSEDYIRYVNELKTLSCHEDSNIIEEQFVQILDDYNNNMLNVEKKTYIISCPVEVQIFDENEILVGTISAEKYDIPKEYQMYIYRVEETDSNVVTVPDDYIVKIKGLDDGEMSIISGEFADGKLRNSSSAQNIPISSEYFNRVNIIEDNIELYDYNTGTANYYLTININPMLIIICAVAVIALSAVGFIVICIRKFKRL